MNVSHRGADSLPESWAETRIGEIYEVVGGGTPSTASDEYWGGDVPWITSADIDDLRDVKVRRHVTPKGIRNSTTTMVPQGTLLVATRVGLGKIAIANTPICFSQDLQGLVQRPDLVVPEYCLYYLSSELQRLKFDGRGTTISGITKKQLKDTPFPLAPYSEQRRIVARVEELFSELDKGVESLTTARRQLEVYRQSVLKHAFEGKLTAQWREENKGRLEPPEELLARVKKARAARCEEQQQEWKRTVGIWETRGRRGRRPAKPKPTTTPTLFGQEDGRDLPDLPHGWVWIRLAQLFSASPQNGVYKPASEYGSGTQIIRIDDFYDGQLVRRAGFKRLHLDNDEIQKYQVQNSELIINRVNSIEYLGKCAIVEALTEKTVFESNIMKCCFIEDVISTAYVAAYLTSREGHSRLSENAKHAVNQASINQTDVGNTLVPVTGMEEQLLIVQTLGLELSQADALISEVETLLTKAGTLRQGILKTAFAGQLVPQVPQDEPALRLLGRIRAKRGETVDNSSKKTRERKTTA